MQSETALTLFCQPWAKGLVLSLPWLNFPPPPCWAIKHTLENPTYCYNSTVRDNIEKSRKVTTDTLKLNWKKEKTLSVSWDSEQYPEGMKSAMCFTYVEFITELEITFVVLEQNKYWFIQDELHFSSLQFILKSNLGPSVVLKWCRLFQRAIHFVLKALK